MGKIKAEIAGKILTLLGYDGTDFYNVTVDANGHLQVDALSSALPTGAATAANQVTVNATLELIALIRNALQSVDTDRIKVRGEDQFFSFGSVVWDYASGNLALPGGHIDSNPVPAGKVWVITTIKVMDVTSPTTYHEYNVMHGGVGRGFHGEFRAFAAQEPSFYTWVVFLEAGDFFRINFTGGLAGDNCYLWYGGFQMTKEA